MEIRILQYLLKLLDSLTGGAPSPWISTRKNWKTLPGSTRATGRFMLIQSSFIPYMTIMDMSVELHQARPLPNRRKVIENSRGGVPSQHPPIYLSQASDRKSTRLNSSH